MIVRLTHGAVPWWQIALSILIMVAAVYGLVRLADRIYAGGVLRIGPRLRLKSLARRLVLSEPRSGCALAVGHRPADDVSVEAARDEPIESGLVPRVPQIGVERIEGAARQRQDDVAAGSLR
jgi:hypothetical protein